MYVWITSTLMTSQIALVVAAWFLLRDAEAMGSKSTQRLVDGNLVSVIRRKETKIEGNSRPYTQKWIPSDIVRDVIVDLCDDRGICYLSETNKENRDLTKEARYIRKGKAQSIRQEMQNAFERMQIADKDYGEENESEMLQRISPERAVWECLLGFDGYILNHKNYEEYRRFRNCGVIVQEAERILHLTAYYRRTFPSHVATPYHRLEAVRGNFSESKLCLFDEYVPLYQMASELADQAKEHESMHRFYVIPIMGDIAKFIGYPDITMSSTLQEDNPFHALLTNILPGIAEGIDIGPFVERVKAFQVKVLEQFEQNDKGCV